MPGRLAANVLVGVLAVVLAGFLEGSVGFNLFCHAQKDGVNLIFKPVPHPRLQRLLGRFVPHLLGPCWAATE